jgi:hypothetical protein
VFYRLLCGPTGCLFGSTEGTIKNGFRGFEDVFLDQEREVLVLVGSSEALRAGHCSESLRYLLFTTFPESNINRKYITFGTVGAGSTVSLCLLTSRGMKWNVTRAIRQPQLPTGQKDPVRKSYEKCPREKTAHPYCRG